ncbi:MAG: sugar phosphate isomerase/epimerase [Candidatus Omnitrophica bacterium]|nr:sugar phosphate isomerase/epimerase [Candidatus Omnitrophota bacterium]
MISVSTAWNSTNNDNGDAIVEQILELGIRTIELGFSINEQMLESIIKRVENQEIEISSVHNFCPVLPGYTAGKFTPDFFSLSSPENDQREKALFLTKRSVDTTKRVGAKNLIVHAGRVDMEQRTKELIWLYNSGKRDSEQYEQLLEEIKQEREQKKQPYWEAVIKSLDTIIAYAADADINICIENRYYHREIPCFDEIEFLFEHFNQAKNFFYWYDLGHAQVGENLGFAKNLDFLKAYSDKMAGMHLHDVRGTHDHQVPGLGDFDFRVLKPFIKKHTIKVIEVHQPATPDQLKAGITYLKEIGIFN